MDRRFGAYVLLICCLAILIDFAEPDSLPEQLPSDESGESVGFNSSTTEEPSLAGAPIKPYHFYKVSMRWPVSECGKGHGCANPEYFTIHGLWPHYRPDTKVPPYDRKAPELCTRPEPSSDKSMTEASLKAILDDLNYFWPSLINPSTPRNMELWRHEWNYHGKCWDKPQQPIAYLRKALNFARQNSLLNILRKKGIVPDNSKTHHRNDIAKAVEDGLGKIPEINCNNVNELREIRVCYNAGSRRIDCPTPFTTCTSEQLRFPEP